MFALIRCFFISLLIMLQFAAPLLHAHKNSVANFGTSIHLPEFEQINTFLKHAPEFMATANYDEDFITVSSGIKNESFKFLQTENTVFVLLISLLFITKIIRKPCVSLQTEPILNAHFLNLISPRAPPNFYVR